MLTYIIAIGALLGALDAIRGNRLGLGEKFEEGFLCLGTTALGIAGIVCIAPVLGKLLRPAVVPLFHLLRMDPAMFGSLLANNMGGYPLAMELADDGAMGQFSGLIVASMLGAALVYTIPVGLGLVQEADKGTFTKGVMIGMIPIPLGAVVGGLMMGIPLGRIVWNSIPVILVTVILIAGFAFCPAKLVNGFVYGTFGLHEGGRTGDGDAGSGVKGGQRAGSGGHCNVDGARRRKGETDQMKITSVDIMKLHASALIQDNIDLCKYDYRAVDGYFEVPERPGIGQELTEEAIANSEMVTVK